ncbi:MAG: hypothetical protein LC754_15310 [Acidobacteria bacterium]|nr:hypothetical protein [Acidobacteriota bacterium]
MRHLLRALIFATSVLHIACGDNNRPAGQQPSAPTPDAAISAHGSGDASAASNQTAPPVVASAHGDAGNNGAPAASNAPDKAPVATPELDAKVEKTTAKATTPAASIADKKAAAAAYLARGNFYYTAGDPRLYRYALGDFRRALRYQPDNEEAKSKVKQIEDIYTYSVHRPIPTNGLEP